MTIRYPARWIIGIIAALVLFATITMIWLSASPSQQHVIRYGITPYQDSALPVVAARKGWYEEDGLKVELVPLSWDQVMPALRSGAIDVAIYNFNSFLPAYANAAQGGTRKPLFYAPLYVFHGQAIMVHGDSGMRTLFNSSAEHAKPSQTEIASIAGQLKGKRIAITRGTELEQIVLAALSAAGLTEKDVTIVHASPEDSLAAFLAGNVDAFAGGLTERVEARKRGAKELLTQSDVMSPVTDGIVTTEDFAAKHTDDLDKLVLMWFRTIQYVGSDVGDNSVEIREYLRTAASTRYSPEEYQIAWSFEFFPPSAAEARSVFGDPRSRFYWQTAWNEVGIFIVTHGEAKAVPPYAAYRGDEVLPRLATSALPGAH